ncbi:MAG: NADPH-dependent glutamate synthase [Bacteroidetes bacterium]|nr:NADPH-dependent glutamate synthase [Bacteroidota bacterium]MCL5737477.1 NADPH-dependent glutamate synthase [Bacteroidota bacterium]
MPNTLKPSERLKIPRQNPLEQDPEVRRRNFEEVSLGFNEDLVLQEALRCIDCKEPLCIEGCPVRIDIPAFIKLVVDKDYLGAAQKIKEKDYLPAITGRVCPQESQCEAVCPIGKKHLPVAIGKIERFVADYERLHNMFNGSVVEQKRKERVAIVGSGPSGLTCAAELAKLGYNVTIFEALHAAGGVLRYGIPEFRLPKSILDAEIENVKKLGVELVPNFIIGRTATVDELMDELGFEAVFLGTGAGTPTFLNIPGENFPGVYSASEFLTRVNFMKGYRFPEYDTPVKLGRRVAVVGGGDTAMDAVRTAMRLGPDKAYLIYRRSKEEMPARDEEVHHAEQEGIEFHVLTNPVRIIAGENKWVKAIECVKMELGEPDADGRRRPIPISNSNFIMDVDTVIIAVGQRPNPILQATTPGLNMSKRGTVVVDGNGQTSREGVFAGGDLSRGGATVILAMEDGQRSAAAIHDYLKVKGQKAKAKEQSIPI